jgi:hypothetical protein
MNTLAAGTCIEHCALDAPDDGTCSVACTPDHIPARLAHHISHTARSRRARSYGTPVKCKLLCASRTSRLSPACSTPMIVIFVAVITDRAAARHLRFRRSAPPARSSVAQDDSLKKIPPQSGITYHYTARLKGPADASAPHKTEGARHVSWKTTIFAFALAVLVPLLASYPRFTPMHPPYSHHNSFSAFHAQLYICHGTGVVSF